MLQSVPATNEPAVQICTVTAPKISTKSQKQALKFSLK